MQTGGLRRQITALGALLALGALAALGAASAGGSDGESAAGDHARAFRGPTLQMTSFSSDRVIRPGQTSSVTAFCRRGFALLGTRFAPIEVNPSNTPNPAVATLAIVPRPNGATFTFRNIGQGVVTMRATADCTKITGKPSLSTFVARRAVQLGPRVARASDSGTQRAARAARKQVRVVCGRRNSIPSDIGFKTKKNDLAALSFFENKRGRIGIRGVFRGNKREKAKLFLACQQGTGVKMVGRVAKSARSAPAAARSTSGAPRAARAARQRRIVVRYFGAQGTRRADFPFTGMDTFADGRARRYWSAPVPASRPAGSTWMGRGLLDPSQRFSRAGTAQDGANSTGIFILALTLDTTGANRDKMTEVELLLAHRLRLDDSRTPDRYDPDDPPPGGDPGQPECNDGIDNDSDGQIDFNGGPSAPVDAGCLSEQDTTEDDFSALFEVDGESSGATNFYDFKPRGTAEPALPASGYRVWFNPVLHDSNTVNHGGVPISGTSPCAQATPETEIAAGVGDQAPTTSPTFGNSLGPPPDANHMRVVIDLQNPAADPCPTATHTIKIAVDTR